MTKRILIIEDDLSLRPFWEHVLGRHFSRFEIDWAVDAEGAKELYLKHHSTSDHYSLIILDLFLAGAETGLDFTHFLKSFAENGPLIFVSAADECEIRAEMGQFNLKSVVVPKPLSVSRLDQTFRHFGLPDRLSGGA